MTDSNISIQENAETPIIILDTIDDDDESILEADKRHDIIELDQALAKSSNIPSPKDEISDSDKSFEAALSNSGNNMADDEGKVENTEPTAQIAESMVTRISDEDTLKTQHLESSPVSIRRNNIAVPAARESIKTDNEAQDISAAKEVETERITSVSITDDFFSMSYGPMIPEIKKKKKKKLKRKKSEEIVEQVIQTKNDEKDEKYTSQALVSVPDSIISLKVETKTESPIKKKLKLAGIPPPPIDEEEFKRNYAKAHGVPEEGNTLDNFDPYDDDIIDETSEFKNRLDILNKMTQSFTQGREASGSGSSSRGGSAEPPRDYILHITSFLPATDNHAIDISVKGSKRFETIINKTLKYFLNLDLVPEPFQSIYRTNKVVLFWDKVKVLEFMKPESLNIPAPPGGGPTIIELGLYTKHQAAEIERLRNMDREAKLILMEQEERKALEEAEQQRLEQLHEEEEKEEDVDPFKDDELFKTLEDESQADSKNDTPLDNLEQEEGYFKIGLKSEDNKKIIVKVHAETQLASLVKHYLKRKGLPETTKVRLVFDDEDLNINGTVGDTELEEDFSVDVIIKS